MKTNFYSDIEDLCLDIAQKYHDSSQKDEFYGVSILTFHDKAKEIIEELIFHEFTLNNIELESYELTGYKDEFVITIDDTGCIWCEKAKRENGYVNFYDKILYIDSDANSKILTYIHDAEEIIEFDIHDDSYKCEDGDVSAICECDGNCDCKDCEYSDGVDDEIEISDLKVLTFSGSHDGKYTSYCITSNNEDNLNKFRKLVQKLDI